MIDSTITIGNLIEVGAFLLGGLAFVLKRNSALDYLAKQLGEVQKEVKDLSKIVVAMAVATTRLDNFEKDIRLLREGKGFIRQEIEKEWKSS